MGRYIFDSMIKYNNQFTDQTSQETHLLFHLAVHTG